MTNNSFCLVKYCVIGGVVIGLGYFGYQGILLLNNISHSANAQINLGMYSEFLGQAYDQGFTDSDQVGIHCFAKPMNDPIGHTWKYFGDCPITGHWVNATVVHYYPNGTMHDSFFGFVWHNDAVPTHIDYPHLIEAQS